jgi:outer membrane protein assembly factor BamA
MRIQVVLSLIALSLLQLTACSPTRRIPNGERLYSGAKVDVHTDEKGEAKNIAADLKGLTRPKPNASLLGFRYKLYFWNLVDTPRGKGLRSFLRNKLGEPPVFASEVDLEKNSKVMQSRLQNTGYFQATVTGMIDTSAKKKKFAVARYDAVTGPRYKVRNIEYQTDSSDVSRSIRAMSRISRRSLIKPGVPYNLDVIKAERIRIDQILKNRGYYYFSPDDIIVDVDSTVGDNQVDMYVHVKDEAPESATQVFRIRHITVYPNYNIEDGALGDTTGDARYAIFTPEGYKIIDPEYRFRPVVFSRSLIFKPFELYNRRDHNTSLNRLVSMGTFKFVKATFEEADTTGNYLDATYYATPLAKKSVRAEITGLTRSNNATGSELTLSWRNRNAFKGAELLTLSAFIGAESQVYGQQNVSTIRYGGEANLFVPRVISPVRLNTSGDFVPQTRFTLGYEYFNRTDQYALNSFRAEYGYQWKNVIQEENRLTLVNLNLVDSSNVTDSFRRLIAANPTLQRSITRQLIIGSIYNYNFNSNARPNRRLLNYYFNANIDGSGNLLGLITGTSFGRNVPYEIGGVPFSQYIRVELEGRNYWRLSSSARPAARDITLASRLIMGAGYAYGNTTEMPFIKEFFAGGVNSIRAFRARSVGPGTYFGGGYTDATKRFLADQPGDVRFEANAELRFPIFAIVKGAAFVDAGNVWTAREDPNRPGSKFTGQFLSQLAIGAGLGVRFDISFLVLRLDLATPIRKPWESVPPSPLNFNFNSADYRRQNLVLNLAIGYPF